ncbi:hypothetical protein [Rasiella sp. SM2506]|uniref:hypothetical protein n=1 Tax=Rasiella sp. SM2506 TaxID=3423914 RepID=UPI003D79FF3D
MKNNYTSQFETIFFLCVLSFFSFHTFAQVGIGTITPNPNSKLDITSTITEPGGLLLPRMTLSATNNVAPLAAHVEGMVVYNTATAGIAPNNVTPGYYYNDGGQWVRLAAASTPSSDWTTTGNTGLNATNNFLGTTDNIGVRFRSNSFNRFEVSTGTTQANGGRLRAFTNGDAATPIYSWNTNVGTGMFQQAANVIGFSTNTTERFRIPNANQVHAIANGTAALPFYSWASDPDIGMFRNAANTLSLSTTGAERMRFLANGQVILNNTGAPYTGDRFTVQGALDEFAINGYTSGVGAAGVYGENISNNGVGVFGSADLGWGVAGLSTGGGIGVEGYNPAGGLGVRGLNDGAGIGVGGYNTSSGTAVYGWNQGTGNGIRGDVANSQNGVYGQNQGANGSGVFGITDQNTGIGVRASNLGTGTGILTVSGGISGSYLNSSGMSANGPAGSFSLGNTSTGTGVVGVGNNNTASIITNVNGGGVAGSGTQNGVFGYAGNGDKINGNLGNAAGIFILDTDNNITNNGLNNNNGVRATAVIAGYDNVGFNDDGGAVFVNQDSYFGGYFSGGTERTGPATTTTSYAYVGMRYNTANTGLSGTDFKIVGPGSVSTIIKDDKNVPRIMFAPEAPEIVFQDYGVGKLINGQVYIPLDPVLKQSLFIDNEHPLKVFVTLEGDCNGVYVTNKSADGFTVKELQNGTSNVPFSWQIVANRADTKDASGTIVSKHVGLRLPVGPGALKVKAKNAEVQQAIKTDGMKPSVSSTLSESAKQPSKGTGTNGVESSNKTQLQKPANTTKVSDTKTVDTNTTIPTPYSKRKGDTK